MNIDWSKAPEDATHYSPARNYYSHCWIKWVNGELHGWLASHDTRWNRLQGQEKDPDQISLHIERPKKQGAWGGEGLPPIGIECEVRFNDVWSICKTLAYHQVSDTAVAVHFLDGSNSLFWCAKFRPIKTAEQVAAEDREKAIEEMVFGVCGCEPDGVNTSAFTVCGFLYDAGYRKQ